MAYIKKITLPSGTTYEISDYRGTLGTGGDITSLPTASSANKGLVYSVKTAGTYASKAAAVGDLFLSDGSAWLLIKATDTTYSTATTSTDGLMSSSDKTKLNGVATGAQVNVIETVKVNGTALTPSSKAVDITVPTSAADVSAIPTSAKGANNGVAELDSSGKVPSSQLPSFVDDVLEYNSQSAFPTTGESGKIYVAKDTNKTYRWSGTAYVEISASLALGETDSTAYRGDRGKTAYDHSQLTSGNPHNVTKSDVGLGDVGNFKAVSTVASQGLTTTEQSNARANIGAGTGNGTITGITMNGASKGTSGVVDLGTVITSHQDISGKADKSATVSNVAYDTTNKKFTKTIDGTTSDVAKLATTTVPNVTSVGSAPTLGTNIPADDITAWTTNTPTTVSLPTYTVSDEVLTIAAGSVTAGTAASLTYTAKSIPNVTSVGSAPTLGTAITVATGFTTT